VHRFKTSSVTWADTLAGVRRRTREGAVLGFIGAFGIGFGIANATYKPCDSAVRECFGPDRKGAISVTTGVVAGLLGAFVGAMVGDRFKTDNWKPLELPRSMRPIARPSSGGLTVGASIRF